MNEGTNLDLISTQDGPSGSQEEGDRTMTSVAQSMGNIVLVLLWCAHECGQFSTAAK